jgi:hypothetical protein
MGTFGVLKVVRADLERCYKKAVIDVRFPRIPEFSETHLSIFRCYKVLTQTTYATRAL